VAKARAVAVALATSPAFLLCGLAAASPRGCGAAELVAGSALAPSVLFGALFGGMLPVWSLLTGAALASRDASARGSG